MIDQQKKDRVNGQVIESLLDSKFCVRQGFYNLAIYPVFFLLVNHAKNGTKARFSLVILTKQPFDVNSVVNITYIPVPGLFCLCFSVFYLPRTETAKLVQNRPQKLFPDMSLFELRFFPPDRKLFYLCLFSHIPAPLLLH